MKVNVKVTQLCPTLCDPVGYSVHGIPQARILEWQLFSSPGDLSNQGTEPRSPTLQADSLPAEPSGKPENTGVGFLSLIQQIFPTQEWNQGLLHCRQILQQPSYQRSPVDGHWSIIMASVQNTDLLSFLETGCRKFQETVIGKGLK